MILLNPDSSYVQNNIRPELFEILNRGTIDIREWIVIEANNTIVGYISYNLIDDHIKLRVICVSKKHKNKKIATKLLTELFSFGKIIKVGYYEPDGEYWIRPKIDAHNINIERYLHASSNE